MTPDQWESLKEKLFEDYSRSTVLISYKMKEILGFSVRTHTEWPEDLTWGQGPVTTIRLDFYNEPKRTMFVLKYSEYLVKSSKMDLRDC